MPVKTLELPPWLKTLMDPGTIVKFSYLIDKCKVDEGKFCIREPSSPSGWSLSRFLLHEVTTVGVFLLPAVQVGC